MNEAEMQSTKYNSTPTIPGSTIPLIETYDYVIEHCKDIGFYAGYVADLAGAHSQGETLDELEENIREVIDILLEDGTLGYLPQHV